MTHGPADPSGPHTPGPHTPDLHAPGARHRPDGDHRPDGPRRSRRSPQGHWLRTRNLLVLGVLPVMLVGILVTAVLVSLPGQDDGKQIELVVLAGQDLSEARMEQIQTWNREHQDDGWKARLVSLPPSADAQRVEMKARLEAGDQVDLVVTDVTQTAEFARAGYLRRLTGVDTSGFLQGPLDTCRYAGRLWALPLNTDAGLLFIDLVRVRELAEKAEQNPDFVEQDLRTTPLANVISSIGRLLQDADPGHEVARAAFAGQFADYEGYTVNMLELLRSLAQQQESEEPGQDFSLEGTAAIQTVTDVLVEDRVLLPGADEFTEDTATDAFLDKEVILLRNWPVAYRALEQDAKERKANIKKEVGVVPLRKGILGGQNIAVTRNSENPEAARSLAEHLTRELGQQQMFMTGGFASTRESVYSDQKIREAYPYAEALLEAVRDAVPRPRTPYYSQASAVFRKVMRCATKLKGDLPAGAQRALQRAGEGRNTQLTCES